MAIHPLPQPLLPPDACAQLDRMDEIGSCWTAVSELLIPETDLHIVDRDNLSLLLSFLQREYHDARERFSHAMQEVAHD